MREVGSGRPVDRRDVHHRRQLQLEVDALRDHRLGLRQTLHHRSLVAGCVSLGHQADAAGACSGLDHHHVDLTGGVAPSRHRYLEHSLGDLLVGRERNPLALYESQARRADRSLQGDGTYREGGGGADQGKNVEGVLPIDGERHGHHLGLAAEVVGERRPKRAVDEPATQDCSLAGPSLPPEEGSGNAPGRIHAFFQVDGEREKVDSLPHFLIGGRCDQQLNPSKLEHDCSVGRNGQFAGAEGDFLSTHHPGYGFFRQDCTSMRLVVPDAYSLYAGVISGVPGRR